MFQSLIESPWTRLINFNNLAKSLSKYATRGHLPNNQEAREFEIEYENFVNIINGELDRWTKIVQSNAAWARMFHVEGQDISRKIHAPIEINDAKIYIKATGRAKLADGCQCEIQLWNDKIYIIAPRCHDKSIFHIGQKNEERYVDCILLCNVRLLPISSQNEQIEFLIYEKELIQSHSGTIRRSNKKSLFEASVFSFVPLDV